ncbi:hypothetical protein PIB30_070195 [Stylosanthes scabra]|uniref:Uncharacterized protein n=1 Tax=Stylosanthes scabra TaxID=79078 RepID=A0ABU6UMT6_9FABA|nr:hypothetical protein [Stylosanthes scabra]
MAFFWSTTTNYLHLPCKMVGPILYEVVVITGLQLTGEVITFGSKPADAFTFNYEFLNYSIIKGEEFCSPNNEDRYPLHRGILLDTIRYTCRDLGFVNTASPTKEYNLDFQKSTYGEFVSNNMGQQGTDVTEMNT